MFIFVCIGQIQVQHLQLTGTRSYFFKLIIILYKHLKPSSIN